MTRLALILALLPGTVLAHDWLAGKRNSFGAMCCFSTDRDARGNPREPDCKPTEARWTPDGWLFASPFDDERRGGTWLIPDADVQPSEDGQFWLCMVAADKRPRCAFVVPAGT